MLAIQEKFDGEMMTMRTKNLFRAMGFIVLGVIILAIGYIFYFPAILMGVSGILVPVGLFVLLLVAFYLLILSTKY
jgi:uncharacterized membrane protein